MNKKRALVLQGGTIRGAFIVGVMTAVYELLGLDYFDAIYSSSVGIFEQVFFAAGQPDIMQNTWKNYIHGTQLINFLNIFKGRQILDLDYLIELFQSDKSKLNLEALGKTRIKLFTLLTDYRTKKPVVMEINKENIFDVMRAACAVPIIYSSKVIINGQRYIDGHWANVGQFQNLLKNKLLEYDEVVGVVNYKHNPRLDFLPNIIRPSKMPLWGSLDTNRNRIIQTIEQGKIDGTAFIKKFILNKPAETNS